MSEASSETLRDRVEGALGSLWWLPLIRGILLILLGAYALFRPGMTIGALAQVVGIFVIVDGILSIVAGTRKRTRKRGQTRKRTRKEGNGRKETGTEGNGDRSNYLQGGCSC